MMPEIGRRRILRAVKKLLLLVAILLPGLAAAAEPDLKAYFRDLQRLNDELRGKTCRDHLTPAVAAAESPSFAIAVSADGQVAFLAALTRCALEHDENTGAFKAAELWVARAPKEQWPQVVRLYLGVAAEKPAASLDALQILSVEAPAAVREIELDLLHRLLEAADEADESGDAGLALHEALIRAGYLPEPPYDDDFLRMRHGRLLLARGRVDGARERLAPVTDLESVVTMRIDRLYDPLRKDPAFEARLAIEPAVERDLARSRATVDAEPRKMEPVYLHASKLIEAKRPAEALALVDAILARHAADPKNVADAERFRVWLLNTRGYALYQLGRADEGREVLREAAGLLERGHPNVSNIINFSIYLVDEGRAAEALELLPKIGRASPYGQGWIEAIRTCAGAQLGNEEERSRGLEHLKAHESDNEAALARGLLCSNDLDGVAALMVRRLQGMDTRGDALLALQGRPALPGDGRSYRNLLLERMAAVRARAEVRAAADAVGRIEDLPVDVGGDI